MKTKLKLKILAGFMLLVGLLVAAGAVSIIEFTKLSQSVNALIEDNYKTIEASKTMLEALEREDSGILLLLLGEAEDGREIILSADSSFTAALTVAKNNLTEENENFYVGRIDSLYQNYKTKWKKNIHISSIENKIDWYNTEIHNSFQEVKGGVRNLMSLNQKSMYSEATILKEKSHRAIMPGIVAIIGAIVFSILLNFFISRYYVSPLNEVASAIKNFNPRDKAIKTNIKTEDEIKALENEVNSLISRIHKFYEIQKQAQ